MIIYGKEIADIVYKKLIPQIKLLKKKGIVPALTIILVGNNPESISYVNAKKRAGERVGVKVTVEHLNKHTSFKEIGDKIDFYNKDTNTHGLIIQFPAGNLDNRLVADLVVAEKDVDGFNQNSKFSSPISEATIAVLKHIHSIYIKQGFFNTWIISQNITVAGKGFTGGEPVYKGIKKLNPQTQIIDTKTLDPDRIIKNSDILISCTGNERFINEKNCKKGAILLGIGIHRENGIVKGDYNALDIENIAAFYTPTPGGIGPVNVACLLKNVVASV